MRNMYLKTQAFLLYSYLYFKSQIGGNFFDNYKLYGLP